MSENVSTDRPSGGGTNATSDAIESAAFLARSEHRVRVLELLADDRRTREELMAGTDVTRVTLSRILGDLGERGWVDRDHADGGYAITNTGRDVYEQFDRLLETITVGQQYPDVVDSLPTEWFDFELRCLAEAELVAADSADPLAGMRVVADAVGRATTVRAVVDSFTSLPMYTYGETLAAGDRPDVEVVFDRNASAVALENPELVDRWREIERRTDQSVYYSIDETVPGNVDLVDETVFLSAVTPDNGGFDVLRCTHPAVVDWARDLFREKRAAAAPLEQRLRDADPVDSPARTVGVE
ncbi:ArsR family transcriptional regulator [Haloterrigena sp. SYSU A121-1]|uniref:ArsR family transcriptional regulator n=1 Tax=Haloterrigena gelatinilytica TaxID=2741724 RepID=A0A8J8GNL3_9EURY|nr:ArsR family transcriptional regulator [Haloterrigena gelatinilytica]NUB93061.1 ArsR family transcriptional regulator [Haloterrigena gelatinilytica]